MNFSVGSPEILNILIFLILLSSNLYFALRKNRNDNLTYLKDQHDVDTDRLNKLENQLHEAEKNIAGLQATLAEKDKQLEMFKQIFQGRNPDMENFMKIVLAVSTKASDFIDEAKIFQEDMRKKLLI